MAENRKQLLHVRSSVEGKLPTAEQIEHGEIAINFYDGNEKLSIKSSTGNIRTFSTDEQNNAKFETKERVAEIDEVVSKTFDTFNNSCGFNEKVQYIPQNELIQDTSSVSEAIEIIADKANETNTNLNVLNSLNKYTYEELFNLYKNKKLVPNALYAITDYKCAYWHPATGSESAFEMEQEAPDVEFIILNSIDVDKFDDRVSYIRKEGYSKIIECKYSIDPELVGFTKGMTTYHPTGAVYYMKDDADNECDYDFKHVKFKRYAITDIIANTRGDNGTGGIAGPFRTYMEKTGTSYNWSDNRQRIGAGAESEKEFIQEIFSGEFYGKGEWVSGYGGSETLKPLHSDYKLKVLKPFQDTSYPNDKYLAWQTDMYASKGLSEKWSAGTCQVEGMCDVTVDSEDFIYRYTFDYNGEDASEKYMVSPNDALKVIVGCSIIQDTKNTSSEDLHNTVIAISESAISSASSAIVGLKIKGRILGGGNTILFKPGLYSYIQCMNASFIGSPSFPFRGNLLLLTHISNSTINGIKSTYMNGEFINFNVESAFNNNVLFGYYSGANIKSSSRNLFYGVDAYIKCEGESATRTYPDGTNFYSVTIKDNCYANIIAPLQYSNFEPHVNSNTFRAPYNKACEIYGNTQMCSFGSTKWGTRIDYQGAGQGYKFGGMIKTHICSGCFMPNPSKNASNVEYLNEDTNTIIGFMNTDIRGNYTNAVKINDMSESAKNAIKTYKAGGLRYILTNDTSGNWHVFDYFGKEVTD